MAQTVTPPTTSAPPAPPSRTTRSTGTWTVLLRVLCLGTVVGTAAALTPTLLGGHRYLFLAVVWAVVAALAATYSTRRAVPAKYLLPGSLLLLLFIVTPVLATFQLSTTNFGDGTRTTKEQTIAQIIGSSVAQTPDAPRYDLTVATTGTPGAGPYTFFLVDPATGEVRAGTADGLRDVGPDQVTVRDGFVTAADGYTLLTPAQVNDADEALQDFAVPTEGGAVRRLGIRQAFEGTTTLHYDEAADTITDDRTGTVYRPQRQGDRDFFVAADGHRLSDQSWGADIGLENYRRVFTDGRILHDFARIFTWTLAFAVLSVASTFVLGLVLAVTLNDPRVRGRKVYRSILLLPYAIPGFIGILVWSGFFNREYGLLNQLTGLDVNWFGDTDVGQARRAADEPVVGFPVHVPRHHRCPAGHPAGVPEAASIDGASGLTGFRRITLPLVLVSVAPLLVASFAFNFNNFNAIQLLTRGGPFTPDNPTAGGTDILISYTVRLAFGSGGAQFGFASAIAVLLFVITGVMAAAQFRATRSLEEVN